MSELNRKIEATKVGETTFSVEPDIVGPTLIFEWAGHKGMFPLRDVIEFLRRVEEPIPCPTCGDEGCLLEVPQPDGPDFGEPWRAIGRTVFGRNKGFVASTNSPEDSARIVACVNACAGMADPVAKITEMQTELGKQKDEIERLQHRDVRINELRGIIKSGTEAMKMQQAEIERLRHIVADDDISERELLKARDEEIVRLRAENRQLHSAIMDAAREIERLRVALQTERDDHDADNEVCAACISAAAVRRGWRWRPGCMVQGGHQ